MTSGPRRIRVACKACGIVAIRTLRAGDTRTLADLRDRPRCGCCYARASKGLVRVSLIVERPPLHERVPPRQKPRYVEPIRTPNPLYWSTDPSDEAFPWRVVDWCVERFDAIPSTVRRAFGASGQLMSFAAACLALFCGLYVAAGIYGAGGVAYRSAALFLADDTHAASEADGAESFCTTRVAWLVSETSQSGDARRRAANYLSARCPDFRERLETIRNDVRD